ncbi:hypothetical protein ACW7G0_10990 [Lysobacter sp. A286]
MAVLPVPPEEQIIQLSDAGNLAAELAEYHLPAEDGSDTFLQRCVALHSNGDIDLVAVRVSRRSTPSTRTRSSGRSNSIAMPSHSSAQMLPR